MKITDQKKYINQIKKISKISDDSDFQEACDLIKSRIENLEIIEESVSESFPTPPEISNEGIAVFSDGACRGNPGPGSWGIVVQDQSGVIFESSAIDELTTNNKMELTGAIKTLEYLLENNLEDENIHLFTDSTYVVKGVKEWMKGWKARGWKKADKKAPENLDLWQKLDELTNSFSRLELHWVKGHAGHPQNERCDQLANMALDEAGY